VLFLLTHSQAFVFATPPLASTNVSSESLQDPEAKGARVTTLGDSVGTLVHAPHVFGQ
jgi:hypothetical protein